ncbi:acyl-CoA synthetase [Mycolicibacterium palauense]|uniref:acyl-CoA synthetase n=1 Tax=Mycolicibacterium palauense TaxID=2034511 RepID=UPI00389948D7
MFPRFFRRTDPSDIAVTMDDGSRALTFGELDERSLWLAGVLDEAGLREGDVVALLSDNDPRAFEVYWAAIRSGLYVTAINHHLTPHEIAYIVNDSGAKAVIASSACGTSAAAIIDLTPVVSLRMAFNAPVSGHRDVDAATAGTGEINLGRRRRGVPMLYSSGTTGRPKGVKPPLPEAPALESDDVLVPLAATTPFDIDSDTVYLSPAPIYHAAPLRWCAAVQALGGTVVLMKKFDAREALAAIESRRVTHAQFVPTMFVRMLKLDGQVRADYDCSTLRVAIHAAAPCPVEVKRLMIDWWGPKLIEYYGGTEGNGITAISSHEWRDKPGSVGRAIMGTPHICDEHGNELPTGRTGLVYFERESIAFEYHNDPDRTRQAQHPRQPLWTTIGDIGYLDEEGFLYLTDRQSFTIISGGVNIYPQEIENALTLHPALTDVAVIGVPDPEMGERVWAVVQPAPGAVAGDDLARELMDFARSQLAGFKVPRHVEFLDELPRTPTGKLVKHELKRRYAAVNSRSVTPECP